MQPVAGASNLLAALPTDRWALVTSAPRHSVLRRFRRHALPIPRVIVDGDGVAAGKPSPEGYLNAAGRLGVAVET